MKILTARQMNEVDQLSIEKYAVPRLVLMENAGMNLLMALEDYFEDLTKRRIAIICGKGNNGGDGLVLARQLRQRGIFSDLYLLGKTGEISGDARVNLDIYLKSGARVQEITTSKTWFEIKSKVLCYDILVDAILGTGISKPLRGLYAEVVSTVNQCSDVFVLSVDIPSGMFSDSLQGGIPTVRADLTVTFTAPKIAHILNEDQDTTGDLRIVPIGTPSKLLERPDFYLNLITRKEVQSYLLTRKIQSHKGHYGHVAIISGSQGKAGAAALSAGAALHTGSGLVTAFSPDVIQPIVASFNAEIMTEGLPSTRRGTLAKKTTNRLLKLLEGKDAAGMGPGLTTHPETLEVIHKIVRNTQIPLVLDADALNAFASQTAKLHNRHQQPLVLTPHLGEFSRLTDQPLHEILKKKVEISRDFAQKHRVWLVLKTFRTLIATPDGQVFACPLGNPGMATAGMGDVLTGVLTSLLGQFAAQATTDEEDITKAVILGVYLHALAGDLVAAKVGQESLSAGDVIRYLGKTYLELSGVEL